MRRMLGAEDLSRQTEGKALRPKTQQSAAARSARVGNLIFKGFLSAVLTVADSRLEFRF
jgi:hypothetical protein